MIEDDLRATVFIVDDDEAMRDSICWLFDSVGLHTMMFGSASDFLACGDLTQEGCILLDVRMPGTSGMELLEFLKSNGAQQPVIIIMPCTNATLHSSSGPRSTCAIPGLLHARWTNPQGCGATKPFC